MHLLALRCCAMEMVCVSAYKFVALGDLASLRERLRTRCLALDLRGTILLSGEGINAFVSGTRDKVDQFLGELRSVSGLADLPVKLSPSRERPFSRMLVKIKKEIIAFGVDGIDPVNKPSPRLSPHTLKQWLDEGRELTLLDTRNDYEVGLGTFAGAVHLGVRHFRRFPEAVAGLPADMKEKTVVTFCTGGIRCEKAAPFLEREGFKNVFQLDGGILKYFEECGGAHYEGECFVFDKRAGVTPDLQPSGTAVCFVCLMPVTVEAQQDPRYVPEKSCPHCAAC